MIKLSDLDVSIFSNDSAIEMENLQRDNANILLVNFHVQALSKVLSSKIKINTSNNHDCY